MLAYVCYSYQLITSEAQPHTGPDVAPIRWNDNPLIAAIQSSHDAVQMLFNADKNLRQGLQVAY